MKKCGCILVFLYFSGTFLLCNNYFDSLNSDDSLYKKIKDEYLKSFNISDLPETKNKDEEEQEKDLFGVALPELSDFNKKQIIYDIFSQNDKELKSYFVINESGKKFKNSFIFKN